MIQNWCKPVHKESAIIGGSQTENDLLDSHGSERTMLVLVLLIALVTMMMVLVQHDSLSDNGMSNPVDFQDSNDINDLEDSEINGEGNADREMIEDLPRVEGTRGFNDGIIVNGIIGTEEWNAEDQVDVGGHPYEEEIDDVTNINYDLKNLYIANDDTYLYFRITVKGSITMEGLGLPHYIIYLDTDIDPSTGFNGGGGWAVGADYRITNDENNWYLESHKFYPGPPSPNPNADYWNYEEFTITSDTGRSGSELEIRVERTAVDDGCRVNVLFYTEAIWDYSPNWVSYCHEYDYDFKYITIDGIITAGEWSEEDHIDVGNGLEELAGDAWDPVDIVDIFIKEDDANLFIRLDFAGTVDIIWNDYNILLDTDQNFYTGQSNGWWATGGDYLIQDGSLKKHLGGTGDNWGYVKAISWSTNEKNGGGPNLEISVPKNDIPEPDGTHSAGVNILVLTGDVAPNNPNRWGGFTYSYDYDLGVQTDGIRVDGKIGSGELDDYDQIDVGGWPYDEGDDVWWPNAKDWLDLYMANDGTSLYFMMKLVADADPTEPDGYYEYIILIDSDQDIGTGFTDGGTLSIGADHRIINNYDGSGLLQTYSDGIWDLGTPVDWDSRNDIIECSVERHRIGAHPGVNVIFFTPGILYERDYAPSSSNEYGDYYYKYTINSLSVKTTDITTTIVDSGSMNNGMLNLEFYADTDIAEIYSITVNRIGMGSQDSDVPNDGVRLYDDSGSVPGAFDIEDVEVSGAVGTFSNGKAVLTPDSPISIPADSSKTFNVVYDISSTPSGTTIGAQIHKSDIDTGISTRVNLITDPVYSWINTIPTYEETGGKKLCIYYGWPSVVRGSDPENLNEAVAVLAEYDIIVLGRTLVTEENHPEKVATQQIIDLLHGMDKDIKIYGNLPIHLTPLDTTLMGYADTWLDDGPDDYNVDGILWGPAGYDYGVSRSRQNILIEYVHLKGKTNIITATNPDDVMGDDCHSTMNPDQEPTSLIPGDGYLLENVLMAKGVYQDAEAAKEKLDTCYDYRQSLGIQMYVVDTGLESTDVQAQVDYGWTTTLAYGFEGYQYTDYVYSADYNWNKDNLLVYTMEYPENVGEIFLDNGVIDDEISGRYSRRTDTGVFQLDLNINVHTTVFTNIYGHIHGTVKLYDIDPIAGIVIDLEDSEGNWLTSVETDPAGAYQFNGLIVGNYCITIVPFIGMKPDDDQNVKTVEVIEHDTPPVNFNLIFAGQTGACEPRSVGYWKHQVNAYLSKKGKMHETPEDVHDWALQITAFSPLFSFEGDIDTVFEEIRDILKPNSKIMKDKALRQLLALNFNIVSLKLDPGIAIDQPKFENKFGSPAGIVFDVLFECRQAILAEINMETAKDMAEAINEGKYLMG